MYDAETRLYYNNSRYYDAEGGRFISADDSALITVSPKSSYDKNFFAYCDNNPVVRVDDGGYLWNFIIGGVFGAAVSAASTAISSYMDKGTVDIKATLLSGAIGALGGVIGASGLCTVAQVVTSSVLSAANNVSTQLLSNGGDFSKVDWVDVAVDSTIGAISSGISYGATKKAVDCAQNTIIKGINKIVKGKETLVQTGKYGKGAIKRGLSVLREGIKNLNTAQGKSSVIGSFVGNVVSTAKNFFKSAFRG